MTDNVSPRLVAELEHAGATIAKLLPLVPVAVRRLDDMLPGYPSGHTASTSVSDGPQRWQTSDPALKALEALRTAVEAVSRDLTVVERLTVNWSTQHQGQKYASPDSDEHCRSCIRVGERVPVFRGGLCRWCYPTLLELNKTRRRNQWGPDLTELPIEAVKKHHSGVYGKITSADLDAWAKGRAKK